MKDPMGYLLAWLLLFPLVDVLAQAIQVWVNSQWGSHVSEADRAKSMWLASVVYVVVAAFLVLDHIFHDVLR